MEKLSELIDYGKKIKATGKIREALLQCLMFSLSFLMSSVSFAGGLSPFAVGFTSAVSTSYFMACAVGSSVGYAIFFGLFDCLRFVAAICFTALIRLSIYHKIPEKRKMFILPLLTFTVMSGSSIAIAAATKSGGAYIIMCLCEAMIAAAFTAFTFRLKSNSILMGRGTLFAPSDTVSVIFFGCVMLLSLEKFTVYNFSISHSAGYFAIMLFALCGKEAASSLTGICCALTLGFNNDMPHLMPVFALSGLFTGLTGAYGKIPVALSLVISSFLGLLLKGNPEQLIAATAEVFFSAFIFVFIPSKHLYSLAEYVIPLSRDSHEKEKSTALGFSLKLRAGALKDVSSSVSAISELLMKADKPKTDNFAILVKEDVCKNCAKYDFCWNKCREITEDAFKKAKKTLINDGRLITERLPDRFVITCRLPDRITDSFNEVYCAYNASLAARKDIFDAKQASAKQFYFLGKILDETAENLNEQQKTDPVIANALMPVFTDMGFSVLGISAFSSLQGKSSIRVYCSHIPPDKDIGLLQDRLFRITGINYMPPVTDEYDKDCTVLSFSEESRLFIEYHTSSHTAEEEFCGDTARCFYDSKGSFYSVLSDGMGTGTRAALDSVMTCSLVSRLMKSGFSPETAIETVNCALMIKSAEETLSTLDILRINPESGECCFYKAGAATSIIRKGDKTLVIEKSSLPLGILGETEFEKSEIILQTGDIILMMSDGASVIPNHSLKEILREHRSDSAIKLSQIIVNTALSMSKTGKHDDITVTCIKLKT